MMPASSPVTPVTCTLCSFSSKRITELDRHVAGVHGTTTQDEWNRTHGGPQTCACGCGEQTKWINAKHGYSSMLAGHNGNVYSVYDEESAARIVNLRKQKLVGRPGWSKGLTKETDERIAKLSAATSAGRKQAFCSGSITIWSKGLTKETDERIARAASAAAAAFVSGERTQWHDNKTELTDERLKRKNDELRNAYALGELVPWNRGKTASTDPRLSKAWKSRDPVTEYQHIRFSPAEVEQQLSRNVNIALDRIDGYRHDRKPALWVRCRSCGWSEKVALVFARNDRCPKCSPSGSNGQRALAAWIEEASGKKVAVNVRGVLSGRQELDVFVPHKMLAVEFNGLYYHNEAAGKASWYHDNKTKQCRELGITLVHVFEDEWKLKQPLIQSAILHKLGLTQHKTSARKCELTELSNDEQRAFFDANHIDGSTQASRTLGLVDASGVIAAMSLRRSMHKKAHEGFTEVGRFCTRANTSCSGALGKLTTAATACVRESGQGLVTYVDTRWGSTGAGWTTAGWTLCGTTPPRFWWTDCHSGRFNRFKFKADSKNGLTEAQVAERAGVVKIYGCSNLKLKIDA